MGHQIVEEARGTDICLVGLNERGYSIAKEILLTIEQATGRKIPLCYLEVDSMEQAELPEGMGEKQILVIVDDVIFSGTTMYKAIRKIPEHPGFEKIYIAVLADRGHRTIPVQAGIVGIRVPTKLNEQVELRLEHGHPREVVLLEK